MDDFYYKITLISGPTLRLYELCNHLDYSDDNVLICNHLDDQCVCTTLALIPYSNIACVTRERRTK